MASNDGNKNGKRKSKGKDDEKILLQTIIDAIPDIIGIQDRDHRIIRYNEAGYRLLGMTQEEVAGKKCYSLIGKGSPCDLCATSESYISKKPTRVERYEESLGVWLDARSYPVLDDDENILYIIEHLRDISKEKKSEEDLKESEEMFKNLVETTSDWIWEIDINGKYIYTSPKVHEVLGYNPNEVIGRSPMDFMHPRTRTKLKDVMKELLKNPQPFFGLANLNLHENGTEVMMETSGVPIFGKDGSFRGYRGIDRDISIRKKAEEELKFRLKFENVISSISTDFITSPVEEIDRIITKALERIGKLVSVDRSYIFLFRDDVTKMDNTHEWCSGGITPAIDQLQDLNPRDFYLVRTMIDNRNVAQIRSLSDLPPEAKADRQEFESEGIRSLVLVPLYVQDMDVGFIGFDSVKKEREWTPDTISLLKIVGEIIVSAIVRKKAQEAIIQERNRAELYLDLMGHDIGNLHQGIYTSLQIATMKKEMGGDPGDVIARAEEVTKRSMKLVKTVLLLSKLRSLDPDLKPVNICDMIRQSIEMMYKVFPQKQIEITPFCNDVHTPVLAEPLISELFFNLLHNGIKFQERKIAKMEIEIKEENGQVEVHISDHGPGISEEMKKTMFQRFQTGGSGSKTGLGLSLVKALVDRYRGTIVVSDRIEGDPASGARFIVTFPVIDDVNNLRASYSSISSLLS